VRLKFAFQVRGGTPLHTEIRRTKLLIAQSKMLKCAFKMLQSSLAAEIDRGHGLVALSVELLSPEVQRVLMAMPLDGEWMPGSGPYSEIINAMLDARSPLVEEDKMPEDGDGPWRVRLTTEALKILA
jgi:hypothetical protein